MSRAAAKQRVPIDGDGAALVAAASRGTPRGALHLLHSLENEAGAGGYALIDRGLVVRTLELLGIDENGLGPMDRRIVAALVEWGPMSPRRIADMVEISVETYRVHHEPFLLRGGFIAVTPRGRVARTARVGRETAR